MNMRGYTKSLIAGVALLVSSVACAIPITGNIGFGGDGSPVPGPNWFDSTGVTFVNPWLVTQRSGDYAGIPLATATTFTNLAWGAGSGAVNIGLAQTIWTLTTGGSTYTLTVGNVNNILRGSLANNSISVSGTGTLTITGAITRDPTPGTWNFTGGLAGTSQNLSFSSSPTPVRVPEPATLGLIGIALAGLGFMRRRA